MSNDVEALFRKINQAGLPYKVFETDDVPGDILEAVAPPRTATKGFAKPRLVEVRTPEPAPEPTLAAAPEPVPTDAGAEPAAAVGFLRNYAPTPPPEKPAAAGPDAVLLKDLFARMAPRD